MVAACAAHRLHRLQMQENHWRSRIAFLEHQVEQQRSELEKQEALWVA